MRIYLTHCSKEKEFTLKGTEVAVTPDKLYTNLGIQQFMERCKAKNVSWAILSDLYGIYLPNERHVWYEKHPDTVTSQEEKAIIQDFDVKLNSYDEIYFFVRLESFHPFYERVLKKTLLANKVKTFQDIECIESA
ncbi:MAG: hypothetical protein AAF892_08380 [Cyanobacteria bacterium P01_D01_bin.71]